MEKCTKLSQIFPFLRGGGDMCSSHILGGSAFVAFGRNEEVPPPNPAPRKVVSDTFSLLIIFLYDFSQK